MILRLEVMIQDLVVDYRNGWNVNGPYGYSQGFGPGYGIGMWGW